VPLVGVLLAHAVVSEVVQGVFMPHRDGDPLDALADAAGVLLFAWLASTGVRSRPRRGTGRR
jgi:hypothetical protein